ncbi:MAG TPA: LLM class flavin-dependent oxidoreductase [Acidimicrobiales bacterium]|nr:LLM class flavin-dependent oxidoreductase [Acidimicrobiales bacterium]
MKCFAFHFMPFPFLEEGYREKYGSAWVTYPNSIWDPAVGNDLYRRYIGELVLAADMGFDGVCVNEHHQTAYSMMPSPNIIASTLVARIRSAKVAILGNAIGYRSDPLRVAEELAMLDNMSGGRIISGFIRGIGAEYHSRSVNPAESRDRFEEAHDLIVKAWTHDGPFRWEGEYFDYQNVNVWPRPFQQPHPEIWAPTTGSGETLDWAAARGYTFAQVFNPMEASAAIFDEFREVSRNYGYTDASKRLAWNPVLYVADSDAQAEDEFWPHMDLYFNELFRNPIHRLFPVNYMSEKSFERVMAARGKLATERRTFEGLLEARTAMVGSVDTVVGMLEEAHDRLGFENLVAVIHMGGLSEEKTRANIRRLATDVLPKVRNRVSARNAAEEAAMAS